MTISQVLNAYNGYYEKEADRAKTLKIITWETTRWQTWILYNLNVVKKSRINNPKKLISFEWDEKPEQPNPEEKEKINAKFPDKIKNGIR